MKKFSSKQVNKNFRIKVYGIFNGVKINKLVGVAGAIAIIGAEMFEKLLGRAFDAMSDICICKLRRGIKFSFYAK